MRLKELLVNIEYRLICGTEEAEIRSLVYDSRKIEPGSLFICVVGANSDGHDYLSDALRSGAAAVVIQDDHEEAVSACLSDQNLCSSESGFEAEGMTVVSVPDTRYALACLSAAWFGHPAEEIPVIGITGTKGKTTSTYMIRAILEHAGYKVGLIGTIERIIGDKHIPALNTTPESYVVQQSLREMIDAGMNLCVMEVSSQAFKLHRCAGMTFEIGVFTNLSPDHIGPNEHESFEEYTECKSMLFRQCRQGIVNLDDPHVHEILKGHTCPVETYGIENDKADLSARDLIYVHENGHIGMKFRLEGKLNMDAELPIPGKFSVYNALTAAAVCLHFQIAEEDIRKALAEVKVRGRLETVKVSDSFSLMIDYAHNAMALDSLLTELRDYNPGRIVCVFGCGGNRSRSRRFEMGEVSGRLADLTIITSDNPRFEDPETIMDDIVEGFSKTEGTYIRIADRKEAIRSAIVNGRPGDLIVLAGKGHEDYQEICGKKYPMDERVLIAEILREEQEKAN